MTYVSKEPTWKRCENNFGGEHSSIDNKRQFNLILTKNILIKKIEKKSSKNIRFNEVWHIISTPLKSSITTTIRLEP
jgi:hypothetical protein